MNIIGLKLWPSKHLPPSTIALFRDGTLVWTGPLCAPWEDVEFNAATVDQATYERLEKMFPTAVKDMRL